MMVVVLGLMSAFIVMGTDSAQSFFFFERKKEGEVGQRAIVTAVVQWLLIWGAIVIGIGLVLAGHINSWFFNDRLGFWYFVVAFAGGMMTILLQQGIEVFRLLMRPWSYVAINLLVSVLTAGFVLGFTVGLDWGIFGYFSGVALAAGVGAITSWVWLRKYLVPLKFEFAWWPRILRFGAPLLPAALALYVMSSSDRWFIQKWWGEDWVGIYAVGAKFGLIMALGVQTFRKAWWPIALDAMHSDDGPQTFRMIAQLFIGLGVASAVYVGYLAPSLIQWFSAPGFEAADDVVAVLAWQALFYGFFLIGSAGIWKMEKTYLNSILMVSASILNLALNAYLIPIYGVVGAASATAISYFLWTAVSVIVSERLWRVGIPIWLILLQISSGVILTGWLIAGNAGSVTRALVVHIFVAAAVLSAFNKETLKNLKARLGWKQ